MATQTELARAVYAFYHDEIDGAITARKQYELFGSDDTFRSEVTQFNMLLRNVDKNAAEALVEAGLATAEGTDTKVYRLDALAIKKLASKLGAAEIEPQAGVLLSDVATGKPGVSPDDPGTEENTR